MPQDLRTRLLRWVMIQTTDYNWIQHLTAIEDVRQGIGLRAYGQQDPLVAFKREGFQMFNELISTIRGEIVKRFFRVQLQDDLSEETALSRHREAVESFRPANPDSTSSSPQNTTGGQAPSVSRRERRAQERAQKKLERRKRRN